MALEMKKYCDCCGNKIIVTAGKVFICSDENTYCEKCAMQLNFICPQCSEKLEKRPSKILRTIRAIPIENVEEIDYFDNSGKVQCKLKFVF